MALADIALAEAVITIVLEQIPTAAVLPAQTATARINGRMLALLMHAVTETEYVHAKTRNSEIITAAAVLATHIL